MSKKKKDKGKVVTFDRDVILRETKEVVKIKEARKSRSLNPLQIL